VSVKKIYTKTGDTGESSVFKGKRYKKDHKIFSVLGSIDELNALLGLFLSMFPDQIEEETFLLKLQRINYKIMAEIAGYKVELDLESIVKRIEKVIDEAQSQKSFSESFLAFNVDKRAAFLNYIRTIVRRVEREVVSFLPENKGLISFYNRLSDLFFALAVKYESRQTTLKIKEA
jgi:cob(I)alamin adenosyltransferase